MTHSDTLKIVKPFFLNTVGKGVVIILIYTYFSNQNINLDMEYIFFNSTKQNL